LNDREFLDKQAKLRLDSIEELAKHLFLKKSEATDGKAEQQLTGKEAQANASANSYATEAASGDESGAAQGGQKAAE
jgi:hypothetical protein